MIATMGEALVDMIELPTGYFEPCLGGSVCNLTIGLARQGVHSVYLNPLSEDRFGHRFAALFRESGVALASREFSKQPTSIAVVNVDEHGVPSYGFHRQQVADRDVTADALIARFPERLEALHTGGLALVPEDLEKTLTTIAAASARGALVSIDANIRPAVVSNEREYLAGVRRALALAHIVKVSDEDLVHLGLGNASAADVRSMLFNNDATQLVALTRGAKGAAVITQSFDVELPAPDGLEVIDTVGAGDCFHAALLAFLHFGGYLDHDKIHHLDAMTLRLALQHALAAASLNVTRAGCDPATWDETKHFLRLLSA